MDIVQNMENMCKMFYLKQNDGYKHQNSYKR